MKFQFTISRLGLMIGLTIGLAGVLYSAYYYFSGIGDGKEGALAFLAIFGLPLSLLALFEIYMDTTTSEEMLLFCILFFLNWSILGFIVGKVLHAVFKKS